MEAVKSSEDGEGAGVERRWPRGDEGAGAVTALEDTHGGKESDAGAEAGAADLELTGEIAFGGEAVAGPNLARADESANVLNDVHGELAVSRDLVELLFCLFFHSALKLLERDLMKGNTAVRPVFRGVGNGARGG